MIKAKEYYFICDEVRDSIKNRAELNHVTLIPFGTGDIAGFLICDECLGPEPEVEKFFDQISPNLREYRFKKRKKLQAWAEKRQITVLPFSKMGNSWWAGEGPQSGDVINHCEDCPESPVVFILKFELNPLDVLQLEELKAKGENALDPAEAPDYVLLCGACYELMHPDELFEETYREVFDDEMQQDLQSKVCAFMNFDTYRQKALARDAPSAPEVGNIVAACDHMVDKPEFPLHYWYVEEAGIEITVEDKRGRPKKKIIQWLQHCNQCNIIYSGAEAVLDNACTGQIYIIWTKKDYEIFPIDPPDAEDDTTNY